MCYFSDEASRRRMKFTETLLCRKINTNGENSMSHSKSSKKQKKKRGEDSKDEKKRRKKQKSKDERHHRHDSNSSSSSNCSPSLQRKRLRPDKIQPLIMDISSSKNLPESLTLLAGMLCHFPSLPSELVPLLNTMDRGECVCLDAVTNDCLKTHLARLLDLFGLSRELAAGDSLTFSIPKNNDKFSSIKNLHSLLCEYDLAKPYTPLVNERGAASKCKVLVDEFSKIEGMESICEELPDLLQQILDGEIVVLENLPDHRLRSFLVEVFEELGLQKQQPCTTLDEKSIDYADCSAGYGLTLEQSSSLTRKKLNDMNTTVCNNVIRELILFYQSQSSHAEVEIEKTERIVGPARPSASQLEEAKNIKICSSSSDDDDVGPSLTHKPRPRHVQFNNIQKAKEDESSIWTKVPENSTASKSREEWMIVPPKSLGILGSLKAQLQPTNRKFQMSSSSKDIVQVPKSQAEIDEDIETEKIMQIHRETRGKSLVEIHASKSKDQIRREKNQRAKEASSLNEQPYGNINNSKPRKNVGAGDFNWDREESMEVQHRPKTAQQYKDMISSSKTLDSKFSKAITKNFM